MTRNFFIILCTSYFVLLFSSCKKMEGTGGSSIITGKVYVKEFTPQGNPVGEYYGPEERVYIIYGTGTTYDNDVRTSYDGSYQFKYLRKGSYRVFAYSRCDTCVSGTEAIFKDVEITDNNSTVTVDDLVIRK